MFRFFISWWGVFLLAALDSSMLFFLPFGIDTLVIYMAARSEALAWLYPVLATTGSLTGAVVTYWIGMKVGEVGLERLVPARRLERLRNRVRDSGAVAMALPALLPPPFPLTPFILTCGALQVDRWKFFVTFGTVRLLRFGTEAGLAVVYGRSILRVLQSDAFRSVVMGFVVVAAVGTVASALLMWRRTRVRRSATV